MKGLTIVKLGGSVITDKSKPFVARKKVIRRLGREILDAQKKYKGKLIIAHGSGSFGHSVAKKYETHLGMVNDKSLEGAILTSDAAIQINRVVMKNLLKCKLLVRSFSPSSFLVSSNGKCKKALSEQILNCLENGITPVIFGDVVEDGENGVCIFSAEKVIKVLMRPLSKSYIIERIVYCTNTDGVYDKSGKTIKRINSKNISSIKKHLGGSSGDDVTGGMLHKVIESLKLAKKYKTEIQIINGNTKGNLRKSVCGSGVVGTRID